MSAALPISRRWKDLSLPFTRDFAATHTAVIERSVRLLEEPKETPTSSNMKLGCPHGSRYVYGASNLSQARPLPGMALVAGKGSDAEELDEPPRHPGLRYSSFEAYLVDDDVLEGGTNWTSNPLANTHSQRLSRRDSSSNRALGAGRGGVGSGSGGGGLVSGSNSSNYSSRTRSRTVVKVSGTDSSVRSGGRSNFFFGADCPISVSSSRAEAYTVFTQPSVPVEHEAASILGVAGQARGAPSEAQRALSVSKQGKSDSHAEVLALQDVQSRDSSAAACINSPSRDEAPPGFSPLGAGKKSCGQYNMAPAEQAEVEVHVVFPADLDDSRIGTPESGNRTKAPSGGSLGTKSGSTSLLSLLSGSPRSLGTVHDTASGPPSPRSPLPELSAEGGEGAETGKGNNAVPSAHPTPLSMFGGDTELPSDHPTPLSTMGSSQSKCGSRRKSKSKPAAAGSGTTASKGAAEQPGKTKRGSGSETRGGKVVNPAASSFIQRLKYWSAGATEEKKTRASSMASKSSTPKTVDAVVVENADTEGVANSPYRVSAHNIRTKQTTRAAEAGPRGSADASVKRTPLESKHSTASSLAQSSPCCSEIGVKVVPFDTVTSDAASVFFSGESQRMGRAKPLPPPHQPWDQPQVEQLSKTALGAATSRHDVFCSSRPAELTTLQRLAEDRISSGGGDEIVMEADLANRAAVEKEGKKDEDVESDMDWDVLSDEEKEVEEKQEIVAPPPPPPLIEKPAEPAPPYSYSRGILPAPDTVAPQQPPPPPRYMAIVESAIVTSALDLSSTSEHDTSPSEDDGGMMEILTDRLMEACNKIEQVTATPTDELSDGAPSIRRRGAGAPPSAMRRRQASNMSSRAFGRDQNAGATTRYGQHSFFSTSSLASSMLPTEVEEKFPDSDEEGIARDEGAAARKLRRERVKKRARAHSRRKLAGALTVPTDNKGDPIDVHSAAYSGEVDLVKSYVSQGGDLEVRDAFRATPLMLASERGHTEMVEALLSSGADVCSVDENGNSALHLACFYSNTDVVVLLLAVDVELTARDSEGRTPLDLASDPIIWRKLKREGFLRDSGENFDLLAAVEGNDTHALGSFIAMGQDVCGFPGNSAAVALAARRLRLDRQGRGGMTAVHLAAFHGYADALRMLLMSGADPNAVCDDGETPLHTACTGGSTLCATLLLDHGANPLATDAKGFVPCEKQIAEGRQDMKHLLETKAFQATPATLLGLRADLTDVALQIDAEEELFVRKGVAIKYIRKALKKREADVARLRNTVDARDADLRNLAARMDSIHRILSGGRRVE